MPESVSTKFARIMLRQILEYPAIDLSQMVHVELTLNRIAVKLSYTREGKRGLAFANQAERTVSDARIAAVNSSLSISPAI